MKVVIFCLIFILVIYAMSWVVDQNARKRDVPNAPTFRQLDFESSQNDFVAVEVGEDWKQAQWVTNFSWAPSAKIESRRMKCYVWQTSLKSRRGTTLVVSLDTFELPWTLSFANDHLLIASIGNHRGPSFRKDEFDDKSLRHLTRFLQNIKQKSRSS